MKTLKEILAVVVLLIPFALWGMLGTSTKERRQEAAEKESEQRMQDAWVYRAPKLTYRSPPVAEYKPTTPPASDLPPDWRSTLTKPARNVQLEAEMMSLATRPRPASQSYYTPPAPSPSPAPTPIPQDFEIEERGNFWFGTDGSGGHIRRSPSGRTIYGR